MCQRTAEAILQAIEQHQARAALAQVLLLRRDRLLLQVLRLYTQTVCNEETSILGM